jgi:hypothetical protein
MLLVGASAAFFPTSEPLLAQATVHVSLEENFRREPQGQVLGRVNPGTPLRRVGVQGSWTQASLEGWIWTASLQTTEREGMDLVVVEEGGENLRDNPSGTILARLDRGTLLEELERVTGWTRVRRTGWIWSASVAAVTPASSSGPAASRPAAGESPRAAPSEFLRAREGSAILSAPDGDTLATAASGDLEVLAREGSWVRVRMEGWVWSPRASEGRQDSEETASSPLTPDDLAAGDGPVHEGSRVTWTVQFISLERAEAVRTDFYEGEPFILGRVGGAEGPFVYVAVPPDRLVAVQGLSPPETISVTGRIRTAGSALTGTPILDLLALELGPGP